MMNRGALVSMLLLLGSIATNITAQESKTPTPASGESHSKPKGGPNNRGQRAEDKKTPTPQTVIVVNQADALHADKESADITQNKNHKSSTDWWLMIFTGVLAVVAVLQLFSLVWQISTSNSTSEKELRAYVFPSSATRFTQNGVLKLKVVFANSGKTPAHACISWVFEGIHAGPAKPAFPTVPPKGTHSIYFIAPGGTVEVFEDALPTSPQDYEFIRNGIRSLYLCGEISYQDVFNKRRTTKFRLVSLKGDFEAGRFAFCEEGNEAS